MISHKPIIVAIDGYSSCGKSTIAKSLAQFAGYTYVDTGAMYRATALYTIRKGWLHEGSIDEQALKEHIHEINIRFQPRPNGQGQDTYLNGENVEQAIRTLEVANGASRVSTLGFVRQEMVRQQQQMGEKKGIVMDGRDIGTVVFPHAELKLFLTASAEVRAQRRYLELQAKGENCNFNDVLSNVMERDYRDTHRTESPLRKADDAIEIDNSNLTPEKQDEIVKQLFLQKVL